MAASYRRRLGSLQSALIALAPSNFIICPSLRVNKFVHILLSDDSGPPCSHVSRHRSAYVLNERYGLSFVMHIVRKQLKLVSHGFIEQ